MKFTSLLPAIAAVTLLGFSSCKKTNTIEDTTELETTFDLASKGGIAENLTQDAQQALSEAAVENNIAGYGTISYINSSGIGVQCAGGVLLLTQLQRAGGKRLPVAEFLRGFALQVGQRFE